MFSQCNIKTSKQIATTGNDQNDSIYSQLTNNCLQLILPSTCVSKPRSCNCRLRCPYQVHPDRPTIKHRCTHRGPRITFPPSLQKWLVRTSRVGANATMMSHAQPPPSQRHCHRPRNRSQRRRHRYCSRISGAKLSELRVHVY